MTLKTIEAGTRANGADLGVEKSRPAASFPELIDWPSTLQAETIARRYGLTIERARVVAGLAFTTVRGRQ